MRGFETIRAPLMLVLFCAGANAGVGVMFLLGPGQLYKADEAGS